MPRRVFPRSLLLVFLGACATSGSSGGGDDGGAPDGGTVDTPDGDTPDPDGGIEQAERSCDTTFRYQPDGPVQTVRVAGDWGWDAPIDLSPQGDGSWEVSLELSAGTHAYKLVVDGEWIFDPEAGYRTYDGGVENSAVHVGDCTVPLAELESLEVEPSGAAQAAFRVLRGNGGARIRPGDVDVALFHDFERTEIGATLTGNDLAVELTGLEPGKYTLEVTPADADGVAGELVRAPFWIEDEPFDWRSPIYMILIDRFRNGDPTNDPASSGASPTAEWYGGDLAGVADAIESGYFDALGVDTLWLSPFQRNPEEPHVDKDHLMSGYHGYWPTRARQIDPRFGTPADLERLVESAHARGIRVMMDFVINHVHEDHEYFEDHPEWFRTGCNCGTEGCGWTERRLDCLFHDYMPDVNWQNRTAGRQMIDDAMWWLTRFDLDGLRVDAVKHVEDAAVANLSTRIHEELERAGTEYFLLGETAMGWAGHSVADNQSEYDTISRYVGKYGLNGQFDFVLYHGVSYRVFAHDDEGLLHADFWTRQSLEQYPDDSIMTPFVGSHDSQRFITLASGDPNAYNEWPEEGLPEPPPPEAYGRARVAFTWVLTLPGAPLLYYGDEYGAYGGSDPDNRHMWRPQVDRNDLEKDLFETIGRVGSARAESAALRRGAYTPLLAEEQFLAYARHTADDGAVVVLNHAAEPATRAIPLDGLPTVPASFADALSPGDSYAVEGGAVELTVPARSSAVLLPE